MALTDAQAKIIAANKKKKEEEAVRKLAAAQLANAAKNHQTFPGVTPTKVVRNEVQTPVKSGKPTLTKTVTKKTSSLLDDMGGTGSTYRRMTDDSGRLYSPLDVIRARYSIGDSAGVLANRSRTYDNDDALENLRRAAEERVVRQQKLDSYVLSAADKKLPSSRRQMVQEAKDAWQKAKDAGDTEGMRRAHEKAENVRGWAGYSGGWDGSEYITADLTRDEKRTLNQTGQNKLKKARLDRQRAIEAGDIQAQMKASQRILDIKNGSSYQNDPGADMETMDAHGRPLLSGQQREEDEARAIAAAKAVGYGVPAALLRFSELGGDFVREQAQERWGTRDPGPARTDGTSKALMDAGTKGEQMLRKSWEYQEEALDGLEGVDRLLMETALSMGQNLPGIGLSLIPGVGPALGAGLMGAQAAGARAGELTERGFDTEEAFTRGLLSGGVEMATEALPLSKLAKILKGEGGQNVIKSILAQMGIEGTEEGVAYAANYALDKIAQDPEAVWSTEDLFKNVAIGAISGGAMATGGSVIGSRGASASSVPGTEGRTIQEILKRQTERSSEEQQVRDAATAMQTGEEYVSTRGNQGRAEGNSGASYQQVASKLEASGKQVGSKRQVAVLGQARREGRQSKQVKLRRIESIPVEVETIQTKKHTQAVVSPTYIVDMSATLGESGAKAMTTAWSGQGNQAQYASDFIRVYNQALTGLADTTDSKIQAPASLSDAQVAAAYNAGVNDRQASLEEAKTAAQFAPVAGKDSGLVYDDYVKAEMDTAVASEINTVAKQLGLRVQMVDSVKGGEANADIQGSVVSIEKGNPHPVRFLFGHEMTHRVQELDPESYRKFRDYVMSSQKAQDEVQSKLAVYRSRGVDIDSEGAIDEIVADYAGQLIESKDLMKRFIDQNQKNQSMLSRFLTALKDLAAKLTGRRKAQVNDAVTLLEKAVSEASKQVKKLEKGGNASQTGMVYDDGNGHSRYSLKTYREGGRDTLGRWLADRVKAGDLDGRDAKDMIKEMDRIYDICNKYTDVYAPFGKWSEAEVVRDDNGDPVFSVVKANGDYPMNMDFSLVCKKRRPLDAVLNSLVEQGLAEKFALDKESIVVLNDIIRRHGFETACSLCFVDAKRFRVTEVADQFASMYNRLVRSMVPKGKSYPVASFNFGGDKTVKKVSGGIDTMKDGDLNFKEIEKTIRTTGEKSVAHKIAVHLRDNPADRKLVRRGDFISTAGFDRVKKDNPALLSLYNSKKGSAGPKASFSDVQYLSEILEQKFFKRDAAYAVGGVRIQSFSDYMPRLFFDYAQMIADLAAKKLPAHGYTKEALFAQQFGQTGVKINLSLVPKVVEGGVAPGLDANGNYVWQEGQSFGSAVSDKDNGKAGFDLAVQIQNAEGYGDNCGTIAVGVSDKHIEKMLDDPDIRMIIPYHKSGLNPIVAAMNKIDKFENYTNYQNTRSKKTGKKVDAHFDFNTELQKLGDAKAAADAYLAWCEENGYLPKFDIPSRKFFPSQHPNYYKLLIDFSAYNSDGKATPQGDVRIQYPQEGDAFGSLNDLIKQGLEEDALAQAKLDKGVKPILDDVEKELSARDTEWANSGKKYSLKIDSEGRPLSDRQVEFFSESQVRDNLGFLQIVYHGTKNPGFTQFDTWEGAWVSPNREYAEAYAAEGSQPYELYANITKPADLGELNVPLDEKVGRRLAEAIGVSYSALRKDVSRLSGQFAYELTKGRYFVKLARQKGFDGFMATEAGVETWAVFSPEQLKEVGNTNPAGSGDIRYSLKGISGYENLVEKFDDIPKRTKASRPKTVEEQALVDDMYYGRKAEERRVKSKEAVAEAKQEGRDAVRAARAEGREAVREARAEGREAVKAVRAEDRETKRIAVQKAKFDQKARDEERIRNLRERKNTQIADIKAKHRERIKLVKAEGRAERDAAVSKVKEHYKGKEAKARESRQARELRNKIVRHVNDLRKKLITPSDNQHIPKKLEPAVANLLACINMESGYAYDPATMRQVIRKDGKSGGMVGKHVPKGQGTPTARTKAFQELRLAYEKILSEADQQMVIDPDLMTNIQEMEALKDTPIGDLTVSQLTTMWNTIRAVEASITSYNKLFGQQKFETIREVAEGLKADNAGKRDRGDYRGPIGAMDKLINAGMLTPESYFHRLGKTGESIFRMLRNAQDKHIGLMQEAQKYTEMVVKDVDVRKLEKEPHTFDVEGQQVTMTTAQIMSLYELMKRQQAVDHVVEGGIRVEAVSKGLKKKGMSEAVRVSPEKVGEILEVLTPKQIEIADGLQKFMGDRLSQLGNEASMEVYGYEKFEEKNYFPIKVDSNQTISDQAKDAVSATIAGRGFTKGTKPHANNALMVRNIFDVYADHVTDMATYSSWLAPMENLQRIFNFKFRDDEGNLTGTVKGLIHRIYGQNGEAYWKKLTEDLNNGVKGVNDNPFQALIGNYKASAIGANLRVFVQQPTSILRALDSISMADFMAGITKANPNTWKKVKEYAPIAVWKDWGYFDADTGRQMKSILFGDDSGIAKVNNALMAPAGAMDSLAWSHIWNALEVETARKHKDLQKGSDAFYKKVAERFNEVVDHTQVVDGILQRSQVMRSPDGVTKMATSFMAEPTKIFNMFTTAAYDMRKSQDNAFRKKARKTMARTSVALFISFVANAAAQSLVDAFRDDDKDEEYWEKFFQAFVGLEGDEETKMDKVKSIASGNMGKALNPFGYLPFVKDVVSLVEGYDVSRMDMESISNVVLAVGNCIKSLNGEGKMTPANALLNLAAELSRFLGTPVSNIKRDVMAGINTWLNLTDNYKGQYAVAKVLYDVNYSGNKGMFLDIAYLAWRDGDKETFVQISQDLMDAFPDDVNGQTIESAMKSHTEKQMEEDPEYQPTQTLEDLIGILPEYAEEEEKEEEFSAKNLNAEEYNRFMQQRAESYRRYEDAVTNSPVWGEMDDKAKDKVISQLWKYAAQTALEDVSGGKFVMDESAMVKAKSLEENHQVDPGTFFTLYGMTSVIKSDKNVDGEEISDSAAYKKLLTVRESGLLDSYTDEQQTAVYGALEISGKLRSMSEDALTDIAAKIEAEKNAPSFYADFPEEKREEVEGILETLGSFTTEYDSKGKQISGKGKQDKIKAEIYTHYNSGEYTAHQCYLLFHRFYTSDKNNPWAYAKNG